MVNMVRIKWLKKNDFPIKIARNLFFWHLERKKVINKQKLKISLGLCAFQKNRTKTTNPILSESNQACLCGLVFSLSLSKIKAE
jgi:hypothetical protein